jgi:hypothetical protein
MCGAIRRYLKSTWAGSFIFDLHRKFLFLDFAARKRNIFSRPVVTTLCHQPCNILWLYQTCYNNIVTSVIMPSSLLQVVNSLFQTEYRTTTSMSIYIDLHQVFFKYYNIQSVLFSFLPNYYTLINFKCWHAATVQWESAHKVFWIQKVLITI